MSAPDNSPAMITLEGVMALQKERDDLRRRLDNLAKVSSEILNPLRHGGWASCADALESAIEAAKGGE